MTALTIPVFFFLVCVQQGWLITRCCSAMAGCPIGAHGEIFQRRYPLRDVLIHRRGAVLPRMLCPHCASAGRSRAGPSARRTIGLRAQLDQDLANLAGEFELPVATLRGGPSIWTIAPLGPERSALRRRLGNRFFPLSEAIGEVARRSPIPHLRPEHRGVARWKLS